MRVGGSRMAMSWQPSRRLASFSAAVRPSFQVPLGLSSQAWARASSVLTQLSRLGLSRMTLSPRLRNRPMIAAGMAGSRTVPSG